jgi:hypothetical protein
VNDADLRAAYPASPEMFQPAPSSAPDPVLVAAFPASPEIFPPSAPVRESGVDALDVLPAEMAASLRGDVRETLGASGPQRVARAERWAADAKAALGSKFDETIVAARSAVPASMKPLLNRTGLGNRLDVILAFADLARHRGR